MPPHSGGGVITIMDQPDSERFYRAVQFEKEGDFAMALQEYCRIAEEGSANKEVYINLGSLYSRMNRFSEAMQCYEKALTLGEDYIVYFNIGSMYYKKGEYKKAVLELEKSRRLNGDFILTLLVMGLSFSRLRNLKAAESCFAEVLRMWPDNRVALMAMAFIYYETGRYVRALETIGKIAQADSGATAIKKLRADTLYKMNNFEDATAEWKSIKDRDADYTAYDEFIKTIPAEMYTDKYGTIHEKIEQLKTRTHYGGDKEDFIALSLCYLLSGNTDRVIDCLMELKKSMVN